MTVLTGKRTAAGVLTGALLLLVSACANPIPGTPTAAPAPKQPQGAQVGKPADLPYDRNAELAKAWATMRTWDLCAIHDPTEAKNMLKGDGGSVIPYTDLSGCKVDVDTFHNTWTFRLDLNRPGNFDEQPKKETVDGTELDRYREPSLGECEYQLPFRDQAVLSLTVSSVEDSEKSRTCDVAKQYLHKILPKMKNPPKVGTGASTPAMRLGGQDPCAGLAAIRRDIQGGASDEDLLIGVDSPVDCQIGITDPSTYRLTDYELRFTVGYHFDLEEGKKVEVAGLKGVSDKLSSDCRTTLDVGQPPIELSNYGGENYQIIEITTPECGQTDLMEKMLAPYKEALSSEPVPPVEDAVHLGDLNPPSSADDVGAPYDPCKIVSWDDFPSAAKDADKPSPYLGEFNDNDRNVQTGCVFHGEQVVTTVAWGRDSLETLQKRNAIGGKETRVHGRSATRELSTTDNGKKLCTEFVSAQQGVIAIATSQNYSNVDACSVNDKLLKIITDQVP